MQSGRPPLRLRACRPPAPALPAALALALALVLALLEILRATRLCCEGAVLAVAAALQSLRSREAAARAETPQQRALVQRADLARRCGFAALPVPALLLLRFPIDTDTATAVDRDRQSAFASTAVLPQAQAQFRPMMLALVPLPTKRLSA